MKIHGRPRIALRGAFVALEDASSPPPVSRQRSSLRVSADFTRLNSFLQFNQNARRSRQIDILILPQTSPTLFSTMKGVYTLGSYIPKIAASCWIAPNAAVVGNVILHEHSSVWFGATIRGDNPEPITVGERSNVQDGAVLHADNGIPLTIGNGVTIGHQAMLHGCTIGENTLIGIGATVLNKSVVGSNCVIGAHCLIPENKVIPDGSLVVGSPGKVVRQLTEEQIEGLKMGADNYVKNSEWFREALLDDGDGDAVQSKL